MDDAEQQAHDEAAQQALALARAIFDEVPRHRGSLVIPTRSLALMVLLEHGARAVTEVAGLLRCAQASATNIIEEAEALGLVERRRLSTAKPRGNVSSSKRGYNDGRDARIHVVQLTPKGIRMRRARRGSGG